MRGNEGRRKLNRDEVEFAIPFIIAILGLIAFFASPEFRNSPSRGSGDNVPAMYERALTKQQTVSNSSGAIIIQGNNNTVYVNNGGICE